MSVRFKTRHHAPSPASKNSAAGAKKQTALPDRLGPDDPQAKIVRWFFLVFATICSVLGIIRCLQTGNFIELAILNAPLLVVLHYYFPKRRG